MANAPSAPKSRGEDGQGRASPPDEPRLPPRGPADALPQAGRGKIGAVPEAEARSLRSSSRERGARLRGRLQRDEEEPLARLYAG